MSLYPCGCVIGYDHTCKTGYDLRRDRWRPDYEVVPVQRLGQEWPDLILEKWERNDIGERRFVESRTYVVGTIDGE